MKVKLCKGCKQLIEVVDGRMLEHYGVHRVKEANERLTTSGKLCVGDGR